MSEFEKEVPTLLARNDSNSLQLNNLKANNLSIGDKVLIFIHAQNSKINENFW